MSYSNLNHSFILVYWTIRIAHTTMWSVVKSRSCVEVFRFRCFSFSRSGFYECIQICPTHMAVLVQFQCVPCIEPCNRVKRTRFKSEIELYNANAHTQNIAHDVSVLMTSHFLQYCKETTDPYFHTNACPHSPTHSHTTVTAAGLRLATGWSRISSTRTVWDTKRDAHNN